MEQLMVAKQRDHKSHVKSRPLYSMVHAVPSQSDRDRRTVYPGHVIQLRCDIAVHRSKVLLNNLPVVPSNHSTVATGRLKSARLLPMGVLHTNNNNKEKYLGIVTAWQQAHSRSSTTPPITTRNNKGIIRNNDYAKRRVRSAIPSSRTSMNVDDLLTISTSGITSYCKKSSLCKPSHYQRSYNREEQETKKEKCVQTVSMPTADNIKVRVILNHQTQSELPTLPKPTDNSNNLMTTNKQGVMTTNKQSIMRSGNSKLSPLTGVHCKLPIGTLNGNSFNLTCKNH